MKKIHSIVIFCMLIFNSLIFCGKVDIYPLVNRSCVEDTEKLDKLLKGGLDPNSSDPGGMTLLNGATFFRNVKTIKLLLSHGADLNLEDNYGKTPLHHALSACWSRSHLGIAQLLFYKGADLEARDAKGCTPLYYVLDKDAEGVGTFLFWHVSHILAKDGREDIAELVFEKIMRGLMAQE